MVYILQRATAPSSDVWKRLHTFGQDFHAFPNSSISEILFVFELIKFATICEYRRFRIFISPERTLGDIKSLFGPLIFYWTENGSLVSEASFLDDLATLKN